MDSKKVMTDTERAICSAVGVNHTDYVEMRDRARHGHVSIQANKADGDDASRGAAHTVSFQMKRAGV